MSAEQNKATVLRFYEEVWNKGNVDFALEVFAEDYAAMTSAQVKPSRVPKDNARSRPSSGRPSRTCDGMSIWAWPKGIW